jgi:hypothetical protein
VNFAVFANSGTPKENRSRAGDELGADELDAIEFEFPS